ncbi:HAD-IC family P-type ATPase [Infirmifilum lucidum]|uniref:HAD-IC family P-type ATPase n=1 Tax=Infirmifilum lucidum TaxID=2776706 RepID=A0A7L9FJ49_9CREN|nr:HAD-IC family P-type ATPase [Infirmifilum lucidum]
MLFSGSIVKRGEAKCVVVNTGSRTYFGKTVELVKAAKSRSLQEETVLAVTRYMVLLGVASLAVSLVLGAYEGWGVVELASLGVVFLMSSVPVALPAVLTILQAYGALELSRRGALVTRLSASENLASIDTACFDKTGTITLNRLQVARVDALGVDESKVVEYALYTTREESLDPLNLAIIEYSKKIGVDKSGLRLLRFIPFDPSLKRSEAFVEEDGRVLRIALGEPRTVFQLCSGSRDEEGFFEEKLADVSKRGFRTLAVAVGEEREKSLRLIGFIHLIDPPRPEAKEMIQEMKGLGVRPVMLTGNNEAAAREVARTIGLGENVVSARRTGADLDVESIDGLAEVFPEDKFNIVKKLQERGHVVAVTGDGVNDAPALSQAEVGIAVENATDAAKSAASIVLVKSGLSVIVDAVRISRVTHERALTWVVNKVVKTTQAIGVVLLAMVWFRRMALTPLDMALLLLANDFLTMSIATDNQYPSLKPARWDIRRILAFSLPLALFYLVPSSIVLWTAYVHLGLDWSTSRSMLLLSLVYMSQFRILQVRERRWFWSSRPCRELIISMTLTTLVFTLMALSGFIVTRLTPRGVAYALVASSMVLVSNPLKVALSKRFL